KMTNTEVVTQALLAVILSLVMWNVFRYADTWDREVWNGEISATIPETRNCQTGWRRSKDSFCTEYRTRQVKVGETCRTDSDGRRSCTDDYDTEYKYDYPW